MSIMNDEPIQEEDFKSEPMSENEIGNEDIFALSKSSWNPRASSAQGDTLVFSQSGGSGIFKSIKSSHKDSEFERESKGVSGIMKNPSANSAVSNSLGLSSSQASKFYTNGTKTLTKSGGVNPNQSHGRDSLQFSASGASGFYGYG